MKGKILTLLMGMFLLFGMSGVCALDADTPYTVTMNFIVGADTSFTVELAGAESTIDFNPTTASSKEVEPDSQDDGGSTPIATITNTGNVNLNITHELNESKPSWVVISYSNENSVDWTQTLSDTSVIVNDTVPASETTQVYLWANFTSADEGTTVRTYQINSSTSG